MKKGKSPKQAVVRGVLQKNRKGFGFVVPESGQDVFIAWTNLSGAMHGDEVEASLAPSAKWRGSPEGVITRILNRRTQEIVGTFECSRKAGLVVPDDRRVGEEFFVPFKYFGDAERGDKVVLRITRYPDKKTSGEGQIVQIISRKGEAGGDLLSLVRSFGLKEYFPDSVTEAAERLGRQGILPEDLEGRRDFRDRTVFTIDGADAKDFDDAVSLEILPEGRVRLGVHIADVGFYVREGSILDKEAFKRGTSVYLMNLVVPMLPEALSNGLCSLVPGEDRLTLTVEAELLPDGSVASWELSESVIRSKARLVYEPVSDWIEEGISMPEGTPEDVPGLLRRMADLAEVLTKRRTARGSIDFDLTESRIMLDPSGIPVSVDIAPRRAGNRMIEEFMLLANQLVAERYAKKDAPFVYRVHGAPAPDKVKELAFFFKSFHLKLRETGGQTTPMAIQELLRQTEGQPFERVVNTVTLRSMQKAVYDPKCTGHFGLALDYYCHFTSPIRRYPDLMIHRIIREDLRHGLGGSRVRELRKLVREGAEAATAREQEAVSLEREAEKMKKAEYMTYHIGEILPGIISGVGNFGIFVELENTVEGLVPMSALAGDYYEFQPDAHRLQGIRTHRTYTLGDRITIRVEKADPADRTVTFSLG